MLGYIPPIPADATIRTRLAMIVWGVMAYLGDRQRRAPDGYAPPHKLIPPPLIERMQSWLKDRRLRIEALLDRFAAGTLRAPRPYAPRMVRTDAAPAVRKVAPPEERMPRGFGWMHRMAGEIRVRAGLLPEWLEEPEVKAAVLASPQMVRLVTPLLNAVAIRKPDWFPVLPKRPRRSRAGMRRKAAVVRADPVEPAPPASPAASLPPVETYEIPEWQRLIYPRLRSNWRR
jgi:hypothetical protein